MHTGYQEAIAREISRSAADQLANYSIMEGRYIEGGGDVPDTLISIVAEYLDDPVTWPEYLSDIKYICHGRDPDKDQGDKKDAHEFRYVPQCIRICGYIPSGILTDVINTSTLGYWNEKTDPMQTVFALYSKIWSISHSTGRKGLVSGYAKTIEEYIFNVGHLHHIIHSHEYVMKVMLGCIARNDSYAVLNEVITKIKELLAEHTRTLKLYIIAYPEAHVYSCRKTMLNKFNDYILRALLEIEMGIGLELDDLS